MHSFSGVLQLFSFHLSSRHKEGHMLPLQAQQVFVMLAGERNLCRSGAAHVDRREEKAMSALVPSLLIL